MHRLKYKILFEIRLSIYDIAILKFYTSIRNCLLIKSCSVNSRDLCCDLDIISKKGLIETFKVRMKKVMSCAA